MVLPPEDESKLKNHYRVTVIVWFAMLVSVLIYLGLGLFLIKREPNSTGGEFQFVFYILSVISVLLSRFFRSFLLSDERIASAISRDVLNLAGLLQSHHIVTFAFYESIAIYGLVLYAVWGIKTDSYILLALSLLCFVLNYPKFELWQETYENARRLSGK